MTPHSARQRLTTRYVMLALVLLGSAGILWAPPASADTVVDCPASGNPTCAQLTPIAECVWDNGDGTKTVAWGWDNPSSYTARIAFGSNNQITPGGQDQGQPILFTPGRHQNAFVTTSSSPASTWHLGDDSARVDKKTAACATKPVPQVGSIGALVLCVVVLGTAALVVVSARGRSVATA